MKLIKLLKYYFLYFGISAVVLIPYYFKLTVSESFGMNYGIYTFFYLALCSTSVSISPDPAVNIGFSIVLAAAEATFIAFISRKWNKSIRYSFMLLLLILNFYRNIVVMNK